MVPDYSRTSTAEVHMFSMFLPCRFHDYECSSPNALVETCISSDSDGCACMDRKRGCILIWNIWNSKDLNSENTAALWHVFFLWELYTAILRICQGFFNFFNHHFDWKGNKVMTNCVLRAGAKEKDPDNALTIISTSCHGLKLAASDGLGSFVWCKLITSHNSIWVCLKMLCTPKPNGFADHYPY